MRKERISDHIVSFNLYSYPNETDYLVSMVTFPEPGEQIEKLYTYRKPYIIYGANVGIVEENDKIFFHTMACIMDNVLYDNAYIFDHTINTIYDDENIM